MLQITATDFDS